MVQSNSKKLIKYLIIQICLVVVFALGCSSIENMINQCSMDAFACGMMIVFFGGAFLLIDAAGIIPALVITTIRFFKSFKNVTSNLKIYDLIFILILSVCEVLFYIKFGYLSILFFLLLAILYFSNKTMSKKDCLKYLIFVMLGIFIGNFLLNPSLASLLIKVHIFLPVLNILFYLTNFQKLKLKVPRLILVVLLVVLVVISSYQLILRDTTSFKERVNLENFKLQYSDINVGPDIIHTDNEYIYLYSTKSNNYYLSKYNTLTKEFQGLFSDVRNVFYKDNYIFFTKKGDIYMLNTKNDEAFKLIDNAYYGSIDDNIYYVNGNVYFTTSNTKRIDNTTIAKTIVYSYHIETNNIKSFIINNKNDSSRETVVSITESGIITQNYYQQVFIYDFEGNKKELLAVGYSADDLNRYNDSLYAFDKNDKKLRMWDIKTGALTTYSLLFDANNVENEEAYECTGISPLRALGIYNNKMYVVTRYTLKKLEGYDSSYGSMEKEYDFVSYFELDDLDDSNDIMLTELVRVNHNNQYIDDGYLYIANKWEKMYKYNLDDMKLVKESSVNIITGYNLIEMDNHFYYFFGHNYETGTIYRISKEDLSVEYILE